MAKNFDKNPKITYPPGCKELSEELSKDELVKRLKVRLCIEDIAKLCKLL